jgi:hypothetical protein
MSSRFSAQDYDDRPLSSPRSLVDLSPSSHSHISPRSRARARSGSLGTEDPTIPSQSQYYPERSSIRINTDLTVRAHNTTRQNIHFSRGQLLIEPSTPTPTSGTFLLYIYLAPTRKIALAYDNDRQVRRPLAAFDRCAIVPRTFYQYFHLGSRDSCRHKSARRARPARARLFFGCARRRRPSS